MARTLARLPQGARITDYISLGLVAQWFPRSTVDRVLANSGKSSRPQRDLSALKKGMLCLADRNFLGYRLWRQARANGAELLWRGKKNLCLPVRRRLADGSYLSRIYPSQRDRRTTLAAALCGSSNMSCKEWKIANPSSAC
jgi:hypothetical protein